ncbi:MAG TPA: ABC transporter permease, partial [Mycobacterium sp.]|nr:ABC transporter permease [Mycobacterium sp.]
MAGRSIKARPGRAAGLAVGLLVAAVSFTLLTTATSRSQAEIRGTVSSSFRTSYDILVRPAGSRSALERSQGLVRDNFESGQFGGITHRQWQRILHLPGVAAAAPVANLGWFLQATRVRIRLSNYVPGHGDVLLRVRSSWLANGGLSVYPGAVEYLYVTSRRGGCNGRLLLGPPNDRPFTWGTPRDASLACEQRPAHRSTLTVEFSPEFPVLIAAIDPVQENKLVALDRAVVSGDPLHEGAGPIPNTVGCCGPSIPVLVSDRSYEREPLKVTVERVVAPPGTTLSKLLYDPAMQEKPGVIPGPPPDGPNKPFQRVTPLPGRVLGHQTIPSRRIYRHLLHTLVAGGYPNSDYWTTTPVTYRQRHDGTLVPSEVHVDAKKTWVDPNNEGGYAYMPMDSADVAFRHVSPHPALAGTYNGISGITGITTTAVGEFDPARIGRTRAVNRVPLEAYSPPIARPADPASRAALHEHPLAPTKQIGGYLSQPPFMLTTLKAARAFLDPDKFQNTHAVAPISIIRVKVAGVHGADPLSVARIEQVAGEIHQATGLAVDITAGSSPQPETIALPAGRYGRPRLTLTEGWAKKGAAVAILDALDTKTFALTLLILLTAAGFVAIATTANIRLRRTEIGVLRCLGWRRIDILTALLTELAIIAISAGALGAGVSAAAITALHLPIGLTRILIAPAVALALALAAGASTAAPAIRAATPLAAVHPPAATSRGRRS